MIMNLNECTVKTKPGSILGYLIAVAGLLYLIFRHYIISENPFTIIIQFLSVMLMFWARITFRARSFHLTANTTEGGLVTGGPYRWIRHPIYASIIYFCWACLISFPHADAILAVLSITGGLFIRMLLEEKALNKTYPEYPEYSKRTKRVIPYVL
jgi:protein-S-isoprenylcysteine O-methyltransferase Ste14